MENKILSIDIEVQPFSWTRSYDGSCVDRNGNEYMFSIITTEDEIDTEEIIEITWIEETPENDKEILQEVSDAWYQQHFKKEN